MMVVIDTHLRRGSAAQAQKNAWPRAVAIFASITFAQILLLWPTLSAMAQTWAHSSVYHHGAIAAPISLWLILRRRDSLTLEPEPSWTGMVLALAFIAAWLAGRAASAEIVAQLAFVGVAIASVITVFGVRIARAWAFPLAFLIFMVPFGESLTPALQSTASAVVTAALNATGIETLRDGNLLTTATAEFEMAEACAGLRFVLAMAMAALLAGELAFNDWRKKISFLVMALAAAIVANWVRAYLIVATVTLTDRAIGVGAEHVALGWIIYSTLIIALVLLAKRMADSPLTQVPVTTSDDAGVTDKTPAPAAIALAVIMALVAASSYDRHVVSAQLSAPPRYLDANFTASGWTMTRASHALAVTADRPDHLTSAVFTGGGAIELTLAHFGYDHPAREISPVSPSDEAAAPWRIVSRSAIEFAYGGGALRPPLEIYTNNRGERMAAVRLYFLGDKTYSSLTRLKIDLAAQKLSGKHADGGALFAATPVIGDEVAAHETLQDFFNSAEPWAMWRSRIIRTGP